MLLPNELSVDAGRAAVVDLLEDSSFRERAARVAAEIAAMPAPEELVPMLVEFAA